MGEERGSVPNSEELIGHAETSVCPLSLYPRASLAAEDYEEKTAIFHTVLGKQSVSTDQLQMEEVRTSQRVKSASQQGQVPKAEISRKKLN